MNEATKTLIKKVRLLFTRYGVKSMTMDDVARELGMSKKTLYQHIKTKEELVTKVLELTDSEFKEFFEEMKSKQLNAIEQLMNVSQLVNRMVEDYNPSFEYDLRKYHPDIFYRIRKKNFERMYNQVLENLRQGKQEGLYRENLDEVIIAKLYVSRIDALADTDIFTQEEKLSPDFRDQNIEYHIRGIANEKGIKLFNQIKNQLINAEKHEV